MKTKEGITEKTIKAIIGIFLVVWCLLVLWMISVQIRLDNQSLRDLRENKADYCVKVHPLFNTILAYDYIEMSLRQIGLKF